MKKNYSKLFKKQRRWKFWTRVITYSWATLEIIMVVVCVVLGFSERTVFLSLVIPFCMGASMIAVLTCMELFTPKLVDRLLLTNHGETVEQVVANIWNESVRFMAIFDQNGNKLFEGTTMEEWRITMPRELERAMAAQERMTVVFNHPICYKSGYGTAFSGQELQMAAQYDIAKMIATAPDLTCVMQFPKSTHLRCTTKMIDSGYDTLSSKLFFCLKRNRRQLHSLAVCQQMAEQFEWKFRYQNYIVNHPKKKFFL